MYYIPKRQLAKAIILLHKTLCSSISVRCVSNCFIFHSVEFIMFSSSRIHQDKSFHCEVCNVCLDKRLEGNHKCRPDSGHDECCICLEVSLNKKNTLYLAQKYQLGALFLSLLPETGPPFYVVIEPCEGLATCSAKGVRFIPQLFQDPEYWNSPGNRTRDLPLCSQVRGTQREYSSKPLKHSIVKRTLVSKRYIWAYFYPLKIFHLFGFPR